MNKSITLLLILTLFSGIVLSQNEMTLKEAVSFALENNHDIKIALNNFSIMENNASLGNAGLLPQLNLSGGTSYSKKDNTLTFSFSPEPDKTTGAVTTNRQASLGISGVLFSGGKNYFTYRSLQKSKELAATQTRELTDNILASVIRNYYNVALLKEKLDIAKDALHISQSRVERIKGRVEYGGSLSLDLLNAKVDMQTDSINLMTAKLQVENAKRDFNLILGREVDAPVEIQPEVSYSPSQDVEFWLQKAEENSTAIRASHSKIEQSKYDLKSARAGFFPSLTGSVAYDLSHTNSESGVLQKGESAGLTAGLNLSFDLFNGFRKLHEVQNANINFRSSGEELVQTKRNLRKQLLNAFSTYQNALLTVEVERQNLETLKLNFDRTSELYQLGQVTTTQLRESQLNWISGQSRLINEKYTAKYAEIELYRLSGLLGEHLGLKSY